MKYDLDSNFANFFVLLFQMTVEIVMLCFIYYDLIIRFMEYH